MKAYRREPSAGEYEPRESRQLHLVCASWTNNMAADESKTAALHRNGLGHPARRLTTDDVGRSTSMRREGGPPTSDKDLWILGVEVGLEPRLG